MVPNCSELFLKTSGSAVPDGLDSQARLTGWDPSSVKDIQEPKLSGPWVSPSGKRGWWQDPAPRLVVRPMRTWQVKPGALVRALDGSSNWESE